MYTITIKHKDVGAKVYDVFLLEEADEQKIPYKHWKEAAEGEYAASDDGYVSRVIKRKTYNPKTKPMDYIRFAWGYTFYNPNYNGKPLNAAGRKSNTTLTGKSYIEAHKNSQIMRDLQKHELTEDYTLELLQDGIKMAKDKKDVPSIMRAVENLQDMHGMKDKHLVKTTEKLEATSSTKLLDEIIEEEKSIGIERITQSEAE